MAPLSDWQKIHPIYGVPIAAEQASEQPWIQCHVLRQDEGLSKSSFRISTWLNTNYFLWLLCAGHAESGVDEGWSIAFESQYRPLWNEVQARVREVAGTYKFGLVIPVPPAFQAVITHVHESDPARYSFKICAEKRPHHLAPPATSLPQNGVWGLWQFLSEREPFLPDVFDVVLETWSIPSSSWRNSDTSGELSLSSLSLSPTSSSDLSLPNYSSVPAPPPHNGNRWYITTAGQIMSFNGEYNYSDHSDAGTVWITISLGCVNLALNTYHREVKRC